MKCLFKGCRGHNKDGECGAGVESGCKDFIPSDEKAGVDLDAFDGCYKYVGAYLVKQGACSKTLAALSTMYAKHDTLESND